MDRKKIYLTAVLAAASFVLCAQTHVRVYNEQIRTLRVQREILLLEEQEPLEISFDEMSHDVHQYSYTVRMLNADGTVNDALLSGEYVRGFTSRDITDYEFSINTSREYTHYRFQFPNEDMELTKSGRYRLTIYEDGDPDRKVADVDLCVAEPMVKIDASIRANTDIEFNRRYQQVDVDVSFEPSAIRCEPSEFSVVVTQNNRTDNAVTLHQPTYVEPKRLRYISNKALIFEAGNEYRHFDAFSCFYAGTGIDRVFHDMGDYHAILFADEITRGQYIHEFDSDGRYVVNAERTSDSDIEAEYMWVHWTLPADNPWFDGALYVGGDLFGNEMSLRNRMQYDNESKCYWLTSLVKQGGYDYQYWFVPKESRATTTQRVDGSYWQTENEYGVYVYWRPFGARYDRLVGVLIQKSTL